MIITLQLPVVTGKFLLVAVTFCEILRTLFISAKKIKFRYTSESERGLFILYYI